MALSEFVQWKVQYSCGLKPVKRGNPLLAKGLRKRLQPNFESEGREFESLRARHKINDLAGLTRRSPGYRLPQGYQRE
jgi:hypothetical protein